MMDSYFGWQSDLAELTAYPQQWYRFSKYYARGWNVARAMRAAGVYVCQLAAVARLTGLSSEAPPEIIADRIEEHAFDPRKL